MPADVNALKQDLTRRMDGALETLRRDFGGLRTGRASPALLEPVKVEAYGTEVPITQVGTIGVPEPRLITVQVWDRSMVGAVERAIRDSGLGLNPGLRWAGRAGADPAIDGRAPRRAGQGGRAVMPKVRPDRDPRRSTRRHGPDQRLREEA